MNTLYLAAPCPDCNTSPDTAAELHAQTREVATIRMLDAADPALPAAWERLFLATARMGERMACARDHSTEGQR